MKLLRLLILWLAVSVPAAFLVARFIERGKGPR